jgi:hypothetical protein
MHTKNRISGNHFEYVMTLTLIFIYLGGRINSHHIIKALKRLLTVLLRALKINATGLLR